MADPHTHHRIAEKITEIFTSGFFLEEDVQHYILSTFGDFSSHILEDVLSDRDNCERESLLELIIFPNQAIQVEMENILQAAPVSGEDEAEILRILTEKGITAVIVCPEPSETISVQVDDMCVSRFLARLNLSKKLDPQLAHAINTDIGQPHQLPVRVKLRNCRFDFTQKRIDFLREFFSFYNSGHHLFFPHFDFILDFLHEHDEHQDIYSALNAKKRSCYRNLKSALKFQERLEKYNIETLMMQGIRNQSVNIEDLEEKIQMIHDITMIIFGKSEEVL